MQIELSQILNQIIGLSTQVEKVEAYQKQISSHIQATSSNADNIERVTRGTNLIMEGIARKTDDNHEYMRLLEQSVKQLQATQLDTGSLREGVHQLISDSFMRLQRYLEQRYPAGQPLDLERLRAEAQRELATDLLRKVEQLLQDREGHSAHPQTVTSSNLQQRAMLLQQEVAALAKQQETALQLLKQLRQKTPFL